MEMDVTPDQFHTQVNFVQCSCGGDAELIHIEIVRLLCDTLLGLGYDDGIELIKRYDMDKWYGGSHGR